MEVVLNKIFLYRVYYIANNLYQNIFSLEDLLKF